jgi:hypothetical protein
VKGEQMRKAADIEISLKEARRRLAAAEAKPIDAPEAVDEVGALNKAVAELSREYRDAVCGEAIEGLGIDEPKSGAPSAITQRARSFYADMREKAAKSEGQPGVLSSAQIDALEARSGRFVTFADLDMFESAVSRGFGDVLKPVLDGLLKRIAKLEARPVLEYAGTWDGRPAKHGQFFTHDGSLWFCRADTTTAPPGADWKLAVKRGRDGKDAKSEAR